MISTSSPRARRLLTLTALSALSALFAISLFTKVATAQTPPPLPATLYPTLGQTTGLFWNPAESGWGCNSVGQGNPQAALAGQSRYILFITCFIYDKAGKSVWIVVPDARDVSGAGRYSGKAYRTTSTGFGINFNPNALGVFEVGTIDFDLTKVFDMSITFKIKDLAPSGDQNRFEITGQVDAQGFVTVIKKVQRQVWGVLEPTLANAQEKITPQGVQKVVPSNELPMTCLKVTDSCFLAAVLTGQVLLIDTGVKMTNAPIATDRNRDLVYAVYRTKIGLVNGATEWYVMKVLFKDTLQTPGGFDGVIQSALVADTVIDRIQGTSNGVQLRFQPNNVCALSIWDVTNLGFQNFPSTACPSWN